MENRSETCVLSTEWHEMTFVCGQALNETLCFKC